MFEYTYGEVPASIIEPPLSIKADEDESNKKPSVDANVINMIFFMIFIINRNLIALLS